METHELIQSKYECDGQLSLFPDQEKKKGKKQNCIAVLRCPKVKCLYCPLPDCVFDEVKDYKEMNKIDPIKSAQYIHMNDGIKSEISFAHVISREGLQHNAMSIMA